jgi:hypothetical protein
MREAGPNPFAASEFPRGAAGVVERPPPGIARGIFVVQPFVVELLAVALLLTTLGYYALGLRRPRRR